VPSEDDGWCWAGTLVHWQCMHMLLWISKICLMRWGEISACLAVTLVSTDDQWYNIFVCHFEFGWGYNTIIHAMWLAQTLFLVRVLLLFLSLFVNWKMANLPLASFVVFLVLSHTWGMDRSKIEVNREISACVLQCALIDWAIFRRQSCSSCSLLTKDIESLSLNDSYSLLILWIVLLFFNP